jgi:eukaryotic-like serine/threonine-protein kinase
VTDSHSDRWRQIERLYNEASEMDTAEREAFLARACGGDERLQQEVRSLLSYERAADRFLERPALAEAALSIARAARPALTGRQISGYEIGAAVGVGGMGEVYRARDLRLDRDVAFKVLEPTIAADPEYRRRFEREAQSASALNHPNIVTIYSVAEEGDVTFITMELVQGQTLRQVMAAPMPLASVLDVSVQLASALCAAHAVGIVHRDLKPENIMLTPDGLVKVLDFGIARREGAPGDDGTTIGTLGYMSPEQAKGDPAGPASDQFAFGAILYEMLTGRHAFQRESRSETLRAIVDAEPPPVQSLAPRVPVSLRQIVARCLSKSPDARYAGTRDLERALRQVRDEVSQWPTRRQLLWIGAGTAVAAVGGSAAWMLWPPHTLAVLPFANTAHNEAAEYLCLGLTQSLIGRMNHLPLAVKSFSLVSNFSRSPLDPHEIGRQLGVEKVVAGSVVADGGHLLVTAELLDVATGVSLWTKRYDRLTASIFKLWDELATAIVDDGLHLRLTRDERRELLSRPTDNVEAFDLFLQARRLQMGNTEDEYIGARTLLQSAVEKDPRFAEAWVALAGTYWTSVLENYMPPALAWPQVDRSLSQAIALNPRLPDLGFGRAMKMFFAEWNWAGADRAWQIAESAPDRDIQPELLLTHGLAAWALGDVRQALRLVRRARLVDPLSPLFMLHEAAYLSYAGQTEDAAADCLPLITTHPDLSSAYFTLADVRRAQGRYDEAIDARRKAHSLRGDSDDELDAALSDAVGKEGYARIEATAVRRLELPTLQRRARHTYTSPLDFARAFAQLNEKDRAFECMDQALAERSPGLVFLNVDRAWDSVRADRRFAAAVKQVGLPS